MFSDSPFRVSNPSKHVKSEIVHIPENCDIIFVSDMFVEDYAGGAELTSEAIIASSPFNVLKVHSRDVTLELLEKGFNQYWIFGNFAAMNAELIPSIVSNLNYSILEYDYKYCQWRSPEKCQDITGEICSCEQTMHGKMISTLMYAARSLWWMSEDQMARYHDIYPFLSERENWVLSSVFDDAFFLAIKLLREKYKNVERKGWVVLGSTSWIKGYEDAKNYCEDNALDYEVVWDIPYDNVLEKLARAEGFVYLPKGGDTCPRMVIEAKLLGCKLHINDYVQHAKEIWFDTDNMFDTEAYLYAARERFWNGIKHAMQWSPTVSGYTTVLNPIKQNYPWKACIKSMLGFCNEVIVVDGGSVDGTWDELLNWSKIESRLVINQNIIDMDHPRFAVCDGQQKALARSMCNGDFCWQQDADEVIHENDYQKIMQLIRFFPAQVDLVSLPVVEYWGGPNKIRLDINPWKWRLSLNQPHITHGIPKDLELFDDDGNVYAKPGTDGCDYIHQETGEIIAHANFYSSEAHNLRMHALSKNEEALSMYQEWFSRNAEAYPVIHHYSWFDLRRKINLYRDYWSQHWQSLYNIIQEDIPKNNMFFDKAWKDVTEDEIDQLAGELKEKMGGWVFHERVDFNKPTPHMELSLPHPTAISEYFDIDVQGSEWRWRCYNE